jgi:hypothetical protein
LEPESQPEEVAAEVGCREEDEEILPLAPEKVVRLGETPGPQLTLDSTEVDTAELPDKGDLSPELPQVTEDVDALDVEFELPSCELVIEHLSSEVDFGNSWRGEGRGMFG